MSIENTLAERGNRYGDFADHAKIAQNIKRAMQSPGYDALPDMHRQALEVIADKIARILSGDPNYADNWHDIQGYAKLVEDRLPKDSDRHPMTPNVVEYSGKTPDIEMLSISLVEKGPDSRCRILDSEPASQTQDDSPCGQNGNGGEHYYARPIQVKSGLLDEAQYAVMAEAFKKRKVLSFTVTEILRHPDRLAGLQQVIMLDGGRS